MNEEGFDKVSTPVVSEAEPQINHRDPFSSLGPFRGLEDSRRMST